MIANIDGDILTYSVGSFTNDHPFLKDQEGKPLQMPVSTEAIKGLVDDEIKKIVEGAECTDYRIFLSGNNNYRVEVATTFPYKGNRDGLEKPYHWQTVRDYLESIAYNISPDNEADDELANAQTEDTVLCSLDKDLLMVVGWHYNWRKEEKRYVSDTEGYYWFMYQLLVGDWSTDAILGCAKLVEKVYGPKAKKAGQTYTRREGVGPKKAEEILNVEPSEMLDKVVAAYKAEFGTDWLDKLNEMGALLHMGGHKDDHWNYERQTNHTRESGRYCFQQISTSDSEADCF